jgi:hypothetical protein
MGRAPEQRIECVVVDVFEIFSCPMLQENRARRGAAHSTMLRHI